MADFTPSSQQDDQAKSSEEISRKLHKREQRALERLQEARQAQAKALERFRRAEMRLHKRTARVQRIEGKIAIIRQELDRLSHAPVSKPQPSPSIEPAESVSGAGRDQSRPYMSISASFESGI